MNFEELVQNTDKLYKAFRKSRNRRSYTVSSERFEENVFANLKKLQEELLTHTYEITGYSEFEVLFPKRRIIKACTFRDKVVQHLICDNILKTIAQKICIKDNYAGQEGKGTGMARKRLVQKMKAFEFATGQKGYIFKGDISKYYYNINHQIAKDIMAYYTPCDIEWIIEKFIDSTSDNPEGTVGLALGNQINTFVSNFYLDGFDKFITGELGIKYYGRYADDFYIFHESKEYLKYCVECIEKYLDTLGLNLNHKSQISPFKNGLKYLGFHYWVNNGKITIKLINSKKREHRKKFNRMYKKVIKGELDMKTLERSEIAWEKYASHCTDKTIFNYYRYQMKKEG